LILVVSLGLSGVALAQEKTYQITGSVVETCCPANVVRGELPLWIAIQKGKEPMRSASLGNVKVESHPKVGDLVTVHYWIGSDAQVAAGAWTKS